MLLNNSNVLSMLASLMLSFGNMSSNTKCNTSFTHSKVPIHVLGSSQSPNSDLLRNLKVREQEQPWEQGDYTPVLTNLAPNSHLQKESKTANPSCSSLSVPVNEPQAYPPPPLYDSPAFKHHSYRGDALTSLRPLQQHDLQTTDTGNVPTDHHMTSAMPPRGKERLSKSLHKSPYINTSGSEPAGDTPMPNIVHPTSSDHSVSSPDVDESNLNTSDELHGSASKLQGFGHQAGAISTESKPQLEKLASQTQCKKVHKKSTKPSECYVQLSNLSFLSSILSSLTSGKSTTHMNPTPTCEFCAATIPNNIPIYVHLMWHLDYVCCCGAAFYTSKSLEEHRKKHDVSTWSHVGPTVKECFCKNMEDSVKHDVRKIKLNVGMKNNICRSCGTAFTFKNAANHQSCYSNNMCICCCCHNIFTSAHDMFLHMYDTRNFRTCSLKSTLLDDKQKMDKEFTATTKSTHDNDKEDSLYKKIVAHNQSPHTPAKESMDIEKELPHECRLCKERFDVEHEWLEHYEVSHADFVNENTKSSYFLYDQ